MKFRFTLLMAGLLLFLSACQLAEPKPDRAVFEGMKKMLDTKVASFSLTIGTKELDFQVAGKTDSSDEETPKFDGKASFSLLLADIPLKATLDLRLIGKKIYAKFGSLEFSEDEETKALQQSLSALQGKWWVIENPSETYPFLKTLTEEEKGFVTALKDIPLFTDVLQVGEEKVHEMDSRKYKVSLSKPGLKEFILTYAKLLGNEISETEQAAIEKRLDDISFDGHAWIAKRGGIMNRVAGTLVFLNNDPQGEKRSPLNVDLGMWDFGKSFSVEEPQEAAPFDLSQFLGAPLSVTPSPTADEKTPIDQPLGAEQVGE